VQPRFNALLLALFAGIALCLGAIGIYGVISYAVKQRTREIGVRIALGAQQRDVLSLVVRRGMTMASIGVEIGLLAAFALTRWMETLLSGRSTTLSIYRGQSLRSSGDRGSSARPKPPPGRRAIVV
jgi:putative ABC transport system permease protein